MVNLVVRTALLEQLQGSHSTFGLMGSFQLIHLVSSDNQIDYSHVLGLVVMLRSLWISDPTVYVVGGLIFELCTKCEWMGF